MFYIQRENKIKQLKRNVVIKRFYYETKMVWKWIFTSQETFLQTNLNLKLRVMENKPKNQA